MKKRKEIVLLVSALALVIVVFSHILAIADRMFTPALNGNLFTGFALVFGGTAFYILYNWFR